METSAVQALKLAIVEAVGLSKDALHVYVGLAVFLLSSWLLRMRESLLAPLFIVAFIAFVGEALDMRDDLSSLGHWRWADSLHDIINTVFWPFVLVAMAKLGALPGQKKK